MHYKFENFLNYERGVKSKANGFICFKTVESCKLRMESPDKLGRFIWQISIRVTFH